MGAEVILLGAAAFALSLLINWPGQKYSWFAGLLGRAWREPAIYPDIPKLQQSGRALPTYGHRLCSVCQNFSAPEPACFECQGEGQVKVFRAAGGSDFFTVDEWFTLPLPVRSRWWLETEYGRLPPSEDLRRTILTALGRSE